MTDKCNHTFERSAIREYVETHKCCPISHRELSMNQLVTNHTLAERIERWKFYKDLEKGTVHENEKQEQGTRQNTNGTGPDASLHYHDTKIDDSLALLPQEREMMRMYEKNECEASLARMRFRRRYLLKTVFTVLLVAFLTVWVIRFGQSFRNSTTEEEETTQP